MALFPSGDSRTSSTEGSAGSNWLHNPSFDTALISKSPQSPSVSPPPSPPPSKKRVVLSRPQKQAAALSQDGFRVDPTPDRENLSYDSLYSGQVASYRRLYSVLGLNRGQTVLLDDGRGRAKNKRRKGEKLVRYFKSVPSTKTTEVVLSSPSPVNLGDMVPLGEPVVQTPENYNRSRTAQYNKALSSDPGNVSVWLEFINAQDSLCEGVKEAAMNERKMAIYEEALSSNPRNIELLLGHMKLMAGCCESKTVLQSWKELLFTQPNVPQLWLGYIDYCQKDFTHFSTDSVIALYSKCLRTLSSIQEGVLKSHPLLPETQQWMVQIFQCYCEFLKASGHSERGLASYQAMLELNLCTPPHLKQEASLEHMITELGHYWSSNTVRLGQANARGWGNQSLDHPFDVKMTFDPPPEDDDVSLVSGLSEKEAWLRLENERWAWHFLPWTQEEEPLDGERIVSFEAVRSVLFRVEDDELKLTLVMNTLRYLGALTASHPHSITPSQGRASLGALTASHPHSITPSQGRASLGALTASHPHSIRASLEDLTQLSSYTVSVFGGLLGDDLVFSSPISPAGLVCEDVGSLVDTLSDAMLGDTPPPTHPLLLATLCRLCQQCLSLLTSEHAQTVLGLVWTVNALRAALGDPAWRKLPQKIIKNLLKTHRDNLELWRCCALVEHVLGRDCLPVFLTLLSSSLSPRLVATLVEASLTVSTDRTVALNALLCLSEGSFSADSPVTPTRILKANFVCSNDAPASDVLYFGLCKAYCVYLTKGMSPACGVLDQLASSLSPHDALSVCVRQVRLCLQSPTTEPRYLRGILDSGLTVCPNHPWLLANRLRTEEQAVSVGRLTKESATTEGRLFALLQELRRLERVKAMSGSSIGGLRRALGLLESTVDTQPLLWRIYLVLQALVDRSQLKTLFYRAIHACPWSKCVYMEGARLLPSDQLQTVLELMEEKGIRLHSPLEEVQLLLVN